MLSYRHAFHAGNYADVLKHYVLFRILDYLTRKPAPIRYLDTHAGVGLYNLHSSESDKLQEHLQGIEPLLQMPLAELPAPVLEFVELIQDCKTAYNKYPGSPWIAQQLLREQDRLNLCELHPADYPKLKQVFASDPRIHFHQDDGFSVAAAIIPPKEKRGLVLVDPSYELKTDYDNVVDTVKNLYRKFSVGVYALWYPLVEGSRAERMVRKFKSSGIKRIQRFEIARSHQPEQPGMNACGMLVINPPWTLKADVEALFNLYAPLISDTGAPLVIVEDLVGE